MSPSPPPRSKTGLNPTSGRFRKRLPRKFGGGGEGWLLPGGGAKAGRPGGGTERGHGGELYVALLSWEERLKRGGCKGEDGGVWAPGRPRSLSLRPLWVCAPPPPPTMPPPSFSLPELPSARVSCRVWVSEVSGRYWHEGRWRRGTSWSLEGLECPQGPTGARRRRLEGHRKNSSQRNAHYLPSETCLKLKGCGWRH